MLHRAMRKHISPRSLQDENVLCVKGIIVPSTMSVSDTAATASTLLLVHKTKGEREVVMLAVRVFIVDRYENQILACTLIDPGSEILLIAESLAQRLRFPPSSTSNLIFKVARKRVLQKTTLWRLHRTLQSELSC